jgi:hypothetical protein
MLSEGHTLPHVCFRTLAGRTIDYTELWQKRALALVMLDADRVEPWRSFSCSVLAREDELDALETTLVVTREPVPGLASPVMLVADRWGEIVHLRPLTFTGAAVEPTADDLVRWAAGVLHRCPECEGEWR